MAALGGASPATRSFRYSPGGRKAIRAATADARATRTAILSRRRRPRLKGALPPRLARWRSLRRSALIGSTPAGTSWPLRPAPRRRRRQRRGQVGNDDGE